MRTIVFTGGSSLLAQSWIMYDQSESNYILGLHKRKLENNKLRTLFLDYSSEDHITEKLKGVKPIQLITTSALIPFSFSVM